MGIYVVKSGDSLYKIAGAVTGSSPRWTELKALNPFLRYAKGKDEHGLERGDWKIYPGDKLTTPADWPNRGGNGPAPGPNPNPGPGPKPNPGPGPTPKPNPGPGPKPNPGPGPIEPAKAKMSLWLGGGIAATLVGLLIYSQKHSKKSADAAVARYSAGSRYSGRR